MRFYESEPGEIILIPKSYKQDEIGQPIDCDDERQPIPCEVVSVGRSEWITAAQGGYQAEIMIRIFRASYNGEREAIYHGIRYDIYRTYGEGDRLELYLGTRVGECNGG